MIRFVALLLAALAVAFPLHAQEPMRGVALVIGESKYDELPALANPAQDARAIDDMLGDLGFEVDRVLNADAEELREAIDRFVDDAADADVAFVYYSGHGIEVKGQNFLAPTDTSLASPESAGASMIAVQPILEALSKVVPVSIVLLDACRSDPFSPGQMVVLPGETAPVAVDGQGLAAVRGPTPLVRPDASPDSLGTVIGFAAEPGQPALDGAPGENSPYAAALLKHFAAGGFSFGDVMTMVTEEVYLKTGARQLPWTNSSLRRVLTFSEPEPEGDADESAIKTERRKLLLSISGTPSETRRYVEALAGQEQVPLDALYGMLDVLGVKADDGNIEEQLKAGATRLKELLSERAGSAKSDPELERLSSLAAQAESEGAIALALRYRDEASARADQLLATRQDEAARLRQDMIDIAQTYADNAATAQLNFDHLRAAELYGKAAAAVNDWDDGKAVAYIISQADALTDRGTYTTDNDALRAALALYHEALVRSPPDADPLLWGRINNLIGQAQQTLGARSTDLSLLTASVASFEAALTAETREAAPNRWAAAQNNLGNVLFTLGQRTSDVALLERAVAAFDAALLEYTPEANPVNWATAQSNRASVKIALADAVYASTEDLQLAAVQAGNEDVENLPEVIVARDKAVAILSDVVASLDTALAARPRAASPLDWAQIQHTRAAALANRGKMTSSVADMQAAVDAYRVVLTVYDKTRMPVQWTTSAANLATTLRQQAGIVRDRAPLAEAAALLEEGLALTPREASPLDWAELKTKLGNVWADVVEYDNSVATSDKAVAAYRAASEVNTPEQNLAAWERLQLYIVQIELKTAIPNSDVARLKDARDTAANASDVLRQRGNPDSEMFAQWLPTLNEFISMLEAAAE